MRVWNATGDDLEKRSAALRWSAHDSVKAADIAHTIAHPWYRCQALAVAAEHAPHAESLALLDAAFIAASELHEPNRIVSAASWPLRILAIVAPDDCPREITRFIATATTERHPLRRANALQLLAVAVSDVPPLLAMVVPALAAELLDGRGTRIDRGIHDTFLLVAKTHPELLQPLAMHHRDGERRRSLLATIRDP